MPKGNLTCNCGTSKSVLHLHVQNERVAFLCESCARDDHSLRSFIVAAAWLYGWRQLRFTYVNAGKDGPLRLALMAAIDEEESRAYESKELRLSRRLAWAVGDPAPGRRL